MLVSSLAVSVFATDELSDAASEVVEMIIAFDPNNSKPEELAAVQAKYDALSADEKASIAENYNFYLVKEGEYAKNLNADIAALNLLEIDLAHSESDVLSLVDKYAVLSDASKALVTDYPTLVEAQAKIDKLNANADNKSVYILNSTMKGLAKYDAEKLKEAQNTPAKGIFYDFEEVDLLEVGDGSTGYYDMDSNNDIVRDQKYAKIEMDIRVTDIDFKFGHPAIKILVGGNTEIGEPLIWSGYDLENEMFLSAEITSWSQGNFVKHRSTKEASFDLGVWHHLVALFNGNSISYTLDGELGFETQFDLEYMYLIFYPWACNMQMTNVHYFDRNGKDILSPFRTGVNNLNTPGWTKAENEDGASLLDLIEEALADTRSAYNALSADEKTQVADAAQIERVQALIDELRTHDVTVEGGTADLQKAKAGAKVTITAQIPEDKEFDKWVVVSGDVDLFSVRASVTNFKMPDSDVSIKALFKDKSKGDSGKTDDQGSTDDKGDPDAKAGDVNGDDALNAKDVTSIMKFLVGKTPKDFNEKAADYNGDGKTNAKDVTGLMKFLVKGA